MRLFPRSKPARWSAGAAAVCLLVLAGPSRLGALTITEIFYHPGPDDPEETLEFIEVYNEGSIVEDISGFFFADGVDFAFPEGTFIDSRSYLVVCADADAVRERFGIENVIGNFNGRLQNGGERIVLANHVGSPVVEVDYGDRGKWPAGADGAGYTLAIREPLLDPDRSESWVRSSQPGGTPGILNFPPPLLVEHEIFPAGEEWRYAKGWDETSQTMAEFSDPPAAWRAPDFEDAAWASGPTPIGFGENEIVTLLDDMDDNYLAFAVRKRFTLTAEQMEPMVSLVLKARYDDGILVYLNGEEAARVRMPGARGEDVPASSEASGSREIRQPEDISISKDHARVGENVLAIQVHNRRLTSGDAGFDAGLVYTTIRTFEPPHVPTVVFNEIGSAAEVGGRFVELYNLADRSVDLSGHWLSDTPAQPRKYAFSPGSEVGPGGFVAVGETDLGFPLEGPELSLYLYHPDAERLLDAVTVELLEDEPLPSSRCLVPDGAGAWFISTIPTRGAANAVELEDGVVINEIHYHPVLVDGERRPLQQSERGEFIELFNRSDRAIPLEGYSLRAGIRFDFGPEHVMAPGSYLVVARDPQFIRARYGLEPAIVVGLPPDATSEDVEQFGILADGGETIRLVDPLGNVADEVRYFDEGEWDPLADGGGSSLELIDPYQDNASPHAWQASDESGKAPWFEIDYEARNETVIPPMPVDPEMHVFLLNDGECLLDGISLTSGEREFIANGDFESDTRPWRLWGNHIHSFRTTDEAKVGSASLHLVATGGGNNKVNRLEVDTPAMPRAPMRVHMWARWLAGSNALHISGHNNAYGATVWLPIPGRQGTPGAENSVRRLLREAAGTDNLGPVISHVRHDPPVPLPNQPVRFHARVTDADGVKSVRVHFQEDRAADFTAVELADDGASGDGRAADGFWSAEVPGFGGRRIVNFWVEAEDDLGNVHAFPRGAPDRLYSFIADVPMESPIHRHRVILNYENNTELNRRLLHSNDLVRGTFIFEESRVHYDVGYRFHGSPWNRPPSPRMYRVRFSGDNKHRHQAKRFNISRYGRDQHEGTAYQLLRKSSVPGGVVPYSQSYDYAQVNINGAPLAGHAMGEIRAVDNIYAEFHWPDDSEGEVWKITGKLAFDDTGNRNVSPDWTQFRLYRTGVYPGTPSGENHRFYFNPKVDRSRDSFEPLIDVLTVMDRSSTPDDGYEEKIAEVVNLENFMRTFIVRVLQDDWDTIDIGNGQNAYVYFAPIEGRLYLAPWDMDHTFGNVNARIEPSSPALGLGRTLQWPRYRRLYGSIMKEILDGPWADNYLVQWTNRVSRTAAPGLTSPGSVVGFTRSRRRTAESFLRTGLLAQFEITTESPHFQPSDTVAVRGTAPLDVREFLVVVDGEAPQAPAVEWLRSSGMPVIWELEVAGLAPGKNDVEVFAFSRTGELVASAGIEIHNTSEWPAPEPAEVMPATGPTAGGTEVTVQGNGFRGGATVKFGDDEAAAVEVVSASELRAVTPAGEAGTVDVTVVNPDGQEGVLAAAFTFEEIAFIRGDIDGNGRHNISDAVAILNYLFRAGAAPCEDAADVDDTGSVNVTDAVVLLDYLFMRGTPPMPPFPEPGMDPTEDQLDCGR